ncbi:uncharacterized protein C2orf81 homolog [Erinaceus europaeus]|uniref:Uncharacterized protein C2orf81 homolog n=1 Tax=Erinaceus europaeus TaxID=9365 RepID=A0ABM3X3Y5_ERIEU|nr:uncharacterized protein C2orf81 homolog [Erinaceus europaeus]
MSHEGSRQARDRGMTRSKAEKVRPPTVPVPQVDIVPGRLNEAEWMALTAVEEGEEVVGDILADLLSRVMDAAFQVYLSQQCIPFTISQAREAMLQIIEWRFLARDEGEAAVADDPTWGEDEEPSACATDSWAQGSVPVLHQSVSVELEDTLQREGQRSTDRSPSGRRWTGRDSQGQTDSWEQTPESRVTQDPPPTPELYEEAGEELEDQDTDKRSSAGSLDVSLQGSVELGSMGSLHPSLELSLEGSPLPWVESSQSGSTPLSLEDLYLNISQPDAAGDGPQLRQKVSPKASGVLVDNSTARLQPRRPPAVAESLSALPSPARHRPTLVRLDPARLPQRWVRPQVEVLYPGANEPYLEASGRCQRPEKPEHQVRPQRPRPESHISQAVKVPLWPGVSLCDLGQDPRRLFPPLGSGLQSPNFGSKLPFPSPARRFLATDSVHDTMTHIPNPQIWPVSKWPRGWEAEARMLGEMWAGRTQAHPQDLEQEDRKGQKDQDPYRWPQPMPKLKATSQVMWKPLLLPEAIKLTPGVSLWNPTTQVLLNSAVPQSEDKDDISLPTGQHPIQAAAPKPQVTVAQLTKNSTFKMWSEPPRYLPPSDP